jgi:transposase
MQCVSRGFRPSTRRAIYGVVKQRVSTTVPASNLAALPKRHQAVSGYWHTLTTLADYCRARSYLVSSRNHGVCPINAIHTALNGNPWLPTVSTT